MISFYRFQDIKKKLDKNFDLKSYIKEDTEYYFSIKNNELFLEKSMVDKNYLFKNNSIENVFNFNITEIFSVTNYEDLIEMINIYKIEEKKKKVKIESAEKDPRKLIENSFNKLIAAEKIVSIDCEFNKSEITEIGFLLIDKNREIKSYHFIINKNVINDDNSPFRSKYKPSLSDIIFFKDLDDLKNKVSEILKDIDVLIGHNIVSDKNQLIKHNILNFENIYLVDTQKLILKKTGNLLSLKDSLSEYKIDVSDFVCDKTDKIVKKLHSRYNGLNFIQFFDSNMYQGISLHNGYNDALLTYLLLDKFYKNEKQQNIIENETLKMLAKKSNLIYNKNFENLYNDLFKKDRIKRNKY